jgi:hypothetical protein
VSSICLSTRGSLGSPRFAPSGLFPCPGGGMYRPTFPRGWWPEFQLSPRLPFRVPSSSHPPGPFGLSVACLGLVPLRGITGRVHHREASQVPASFRPRAFSAPRRLAPRTASRACFIPQPRPGFIRVQGLLPRCSQAFSSKVVPPCRSSPNPHPLTRVARSDLAGSEALLHTETRAAARGSAGLTVAPLFTFCSPESACPSPSRLPVRARPSFRFPVR